MKYFRFKPLAAAAALLAMFGSAQADSFFWAVNQFTTIQRLNGDTGAVVDSFAIPFGSGSAASIAFVGNTGYYTRLGDPQVYKVDMTTHLYGGVAFNIGVNAGLNNGITTDSNGHLWFAGGAGDAIKEYTTAGALVSTHAFPAAAGSYRDGSVVFGGFVVANRGDQQGPYDKYSIGAGNLPLTLVQSAFINPAINGQTLFGSNGIAFNGTNFYTSDEQAHRVSKWDSNGNFISFAALAPGSRYENWTFASQDINPAIPEPETYALMLAGLAVLGAVARRRKQDTAA